LLGALPNTPLWRRLEREGRLRREIPGDQFALTNVVTGLPAPALAAGYARVLDRLFDPVLYFERCRENLRRVRRAFARPPRARDLLAGCRAIGSQGLTSGYARAYWRFVGWVLRHRPRELARALEMAAVGHHQIRYAREVVIPRLAAQAAALGAGTGSGLASAASLG
jgi:hypothetical protein